MRGISWLAENWLGCAQTSRVECSPFQSSQTHKDAAVTLWLTYNDRRGNVYTRTESSPVQSHESCRVKSLYAACSISVSHTPAICLTAAILRNKLIWKNLIVFVKNQEEIFDASRCEHRTRDYIASVWLKIAQEMGVGKWSASVLCCLLWWWWWWRCS